MPPSFMQAMSLTTAGRLLAMSPMTWSYPTALKRHRPQSSSYLDCVKSIGQLHDETINIWTHLIAVAVFCLVLLRMSNCRGRKRTDEAHATWVYLPAATLFLLCSTLYHTFENHDHAVFWQRLDHCSITTFIWASSRSFTILAYPRKRPASRLYTAILTAIALGLILWHFIDVIGRNDQMRFSGVTHAVYGSLAAIPAFSRPSSLQWRATRARKRLIGKFQALIFMSAFGGVLYSTRLIERMLGARADWENVGHHAMHLAVVIGACTYGREVLGHDLIS
jgi:adiponectin receptor